MFREMRRYKQAVTAETCAEILKTEKRGVLSVIGDGGYPYAVPLDFYYEEEEQTIYFHCAKVGHKIDALKIVTKCALPHGIPVFRKKMTGYGM